MTIDSYGGTGKNKADNEADTLKGLKDFYKGYFPIGVAVSPGSLQGAQANGMRVRGHKLTWSALKTWIFNYNIMPSIPGFDNPEKKKVTAGYIVSIQE